MVGFLFSTAAYSTLFAVLTVVAFAGALVLTPLGRLLGLDRLRSALRRHRLFLAWGVAAVATSGSLYYSEIAGFVPCELCWFQRIFMYPLAIVLLVAWVRADHAIRWYVLPMVVIGGGISVYHYLLQRFPSWAGGACDAAAPCTLTWVWKFGFISIPMMALAGFTFIGALLASGGPPDGGHRAGEAG